MSSIPVPQAIEAFLDAKEVPVQTKQTRPTTGHGCGCKQRSDRVNEWVHFGRKADGENDAQKRRVWAALSRIGTCNLTPTNRNSTLSDVLTDLFQPGSFISPFREAYDQ
jgi:hypothetical protein